MPTPAAFPKTVPGSLSGGGGGGEVGGGEVGEVGGGGGGVEKWKFVLGRANTF